MQMQKGITLVALVITVIILLILTGVALSMGMSEEGLFYKTNNAVDKWNNKVEEDKNMVHIANELITENPYGIE